MYELHAAQVAREIRDKTERALTMFRMAVPDNPPRPKIHYFYDLDKIGWANPLHGVGFNVKALERYPQRMYGEGIAHEYAHWLTFFRYPRLTVVEAALARTMPKQMSALWEYLSHDWRWRQAMLELGYPAAQPAGWNLDLSF